MASPAATWAIVIVAVVVLAFWLTMIYVADRSQVRASGRAQAAAWPTYPGAWAPVPPEEAPTRADLPAQPPAAAERPAMPTMPAQRTGDADRAERSYAGPVPPDEEGQDR